MSITQELSVEQELSIIQRALQTTGDKIAQGYLYGFLSYQKDLNEEVRQEFVTLFRKLLPGRPSITEQFIQRMLLNIDVDKALFRF
ncbi:MAG: hypothetical protein BalsKO_20620 [Balneolaceae bacterium]